MKISTFQLLATASGNVAVLPLAPNHFRPKRKPQRFRQSLLFVVIDYFFYQKYVLMRILTIFFDKEGIKNMVFHIIMKSMIF